MKKISPVAYPFLTKRAIAAKIDTEPEFAAECAIVLQQRTSERLAGRAPTGKPWGWMSSEVVTAGKLVARLRSGTISDVDRAKLSKLTRRYVKQIAQHSVALALREHPELAEIAAEFGVVPATLGPSAGAQVQRRGEEGPEQPASEETGRREQEPEAEQADPLPRRVLEVAERSPGQRTDEIAKALDTTTAMIGPVLRELVLGKKLLKRGVGRGTRYFAR